MDSAFCDVMIMVNIMIVMIACVLRRENCFNSINLWLMVLFAVVMVVVSIARLVVVMMFVFVTVSQVHQATVRVLVATVVLCGSNEENFT